MRQTSPFDKASLLALIALALLILFGLAVTTIGYLLEEQEWGIVKFIALSTGGGIFAAALTAFMSQVGKSLFGDAIVDSLRQLTQAKILSTDTDLSDIRRKFYYYYKSKYHGKGFWRCIELDFSHSKHPGIAVTQVNIKHPDGHSQFVYTYEAAIREHALILLSHRSSETPAKVIFPAFKKTFLDRSICGLTFHENWDEEEAIDPAIILPTKKYEPNADDLLSEEDAESIEREWFEKFYQKQAGGIPKR